MIERELPRWGEAMQREIDARGLRAETVYPVAGDVIIWHSDVIHGAEPIADRALTRRSLVGHYLPLRDAKKRGQSVIGDDALWQKRRPQPVGLPSRILCAIERRLQRVWNGRGKWI